MTSNSDEVTWAILDCFERKYKVFSNGDIFSLPKTYTYTRKDTGKTYVRTSSGKQLKHVLNKYGVFVWIDCNGELVDLPLWFVMLGAFGFCDVKANFKPEVRFKDNDKYNVCLDNLEIVDTSEDEEVWADVKGFEGLYQISTFGRVKRLNRVDNANRHLGERILKLNGSPYFIATFSVVEKGIRVQQLVHRLVAEAFIPNPENKPEVNHIDGDKKNNNVNNLEWVTKSENSQHAHKLGLAKGKATTSIRCKVLPDNLIFPSLKDAAEFIGCAPGYAQECSLKNTPIFGKYYVERLS